MTYEGAHQTRAEAEADLPRLRALYPDREPYIAEQGDGERSFHVHSRPIHYEGCPTEAHTHEPWTDDDTAELAAAMRDAAWTTADRHSEARAGAMILRGHTPPNEPAGCRVTRDAGTLALYTRMYREDRIADRMGDDPQPTNLPIIAASDHRAVPTTTPGVCTCQLCGRPVRTAGPYAVHAAVVIAASRR